MREWTSTYSDIRNYRPIEDQLVGKVGFLSARVDDISNLYIPARLIGLYGPYVMPSDGHPVLSCLTFSVPKCHLSMQADILASIRKQTMLNLTYVYNIHCKLLTVYSHPLVWDLGLAKVLYGLCPP